MNHSLLFILSYYSSRRLTAFNLTTMLCIPLHSFLTDVSLEHTIHTVTTTFNFSTLKYIETYHCCVLLEPLIPSNRLWAQWLLISSKIEKQIEQKKRK